MVNLIFLVFLAAGPSPPIDPVIAEISRLEQDRDPKCYATAKRLEDFMFGTPLAAEAQDTKIRLQEELTRRIWLSASEHARNRNSSTIDRGDLEPVIQARFLIHRNKRGDWFIRHSSKPEDRNIRLAPDDLRQYSSVSFSLRAILGARQQALLDGPELLELKPETLRTLSKILDLVSLAVLQRADRLARLSGKQEIDSEIYRRAWREVNGNPFSEIKGPNKPGATTATRIRGAARPPSIFLSLVRSKIRSYQAYNEISSALFLRNLQVYFARLPWPKNPEDGRKLKDFFNQSLVFFATDVLEGSEAAARRKAHQTIELQDVRSFLQRILPHEVNSYEDVRYFPRLGNDAILIEAYDLDAFRDGGLHWRAIEWALENDAVKLDLEPDPFAAELIAEAVAQYGVLVLRTAGEIGSGSAELSPEMVDAALHRIQGLITRDTGRARSIDEDVPFPALISSSSPQIEDGNLYFGDVSSTLGIHFEHRISDWLSRRIRSYTPTGEDGANLVIPPAFGGSGIAAEDLDGDGDADLLILSGNGNRIFRNDEGALVDVTKDSGISWLRPSDGKPGEPRQPLIADLDNDGLEDLVITYVNDRHRVYRNLGGFRFEDLSTDANLGGPGLVGGPATILDFDLDGLPDIYIGYFGNYVKGVLPTLARRNSNGSPNRLFRNMGNFRFRAVGAGVEDSGWTQAVGHADINGDGLEDLISGNDFGVNHYYLNEGKGRFREVSKELGTDKPSYTMNIGIADLNRDRFPDFYISNIVTMDKDQKYVLPSEKTRMRFDPESMAHLRVVEANDLFVSSVGEGDLPLYLPSDAVGRGRNSTGWAWDADFFDYDLDGDEDLYCVNGMNEFALYSSKNPYYRDPDGSAREVVIPVSNRESNVFFVNEGGRLENRSVESGTDYLGNSRSATFFDIDGDGDLDIALNNFDGPVKIFENRLDHRKRHWLKLRLEGDPSRGVSRDAIGAVVIASSPHHRGMWRQVSSTTGYLSVHPKTLHFGLGEDTEADLEIHWPGGEISHLKSVAADQLIHITMN